MKTPKPYLWALLFLVAGTVMTGTILFFGDVAIVGHLISRHVVVHTEHYSLMADHSTTQLWIRQAKGNLESLKVSGYVQGEGSVTLTFVAQNMSWPIYDTQRIAELQGTIVHKGVGNQKSSQHSSSIGLDFILSYGDNPSYDPENDGISLHAGAIDFSVAGSTYRPDLAEENKCARWEVYSVEKGVTTQFCNGGENCCDFVSLIPERSSWDADVFLTYGKYGSTDHNIVSAQLIYVNTNISAPDAGVLSTSRLNASADFIELGVEFTEACLSSCLLPSLNLDDGTFIVNITGQAEINISSLTYSVTQTVDENMPPVWAIVPNITILQGQEYSLVLSDYVSDPEHQGINYDYDDPDNFTIDIVGGVLLIIPDRIYSGEINFTLSAMDEEFTVPTIMSILVVSAANASNTTTSLQSPIRIGEKPHWVKHIKTPLPAINITLDLEGSAENIAVRKIVGGIDIDIPEGKLKINSQGMIINISVFESEGITDASAITDDLAAEIAAEKERILSAAQNGITGNVIKELNPEENKTSEKKEKKEKSKKKSLDENATVKLIVEDVAEEIIVEYETPAPYTIEQYVSDTVKEVKVVSDLHYSNVVTFTSLPDVSARSIQVSWSLNGTLIPMDIVMNDTNGIPGIDYVEWITLHLSNETFIIEISGALHLAENYSFVSDIYDSVYTLDNNWSEPIPHGDYIRVSFKENLTNEKDITVYTRNVQGKNTTLDVYPVNSTQKIAQFPVLLAEQYTKIFLTALNGSTDTFDLRVQNLENDSAAYLEFDHIIDPIYPDFFYEDCSDISDWVVVNGGTSGWAVVSGQCEAKNTDGITTMTTLTGINLAGAMAANLSFNRTTSGLDEGENLTVLVNSSRETWRVVAIITNNTAAREGYNLATFINFTEGVYIQLLMNTNLATDIIDVDNINITKVTAPVPSYSAITTNDSAIYTTDMVMFNTTWSTEYTLNFSVLSANDTGSWVNQSPSSLGSGASGVASITKTIVADPGNTTGWIIYANDSWSNWNQTTIQSFSVGGVTWAQTSLTVNSATQNASQNYVNTTFTSYLTNTNVNLTCISGNCNIVTSNYTTATYGNDAIGKLWFTCGTAQAGIFSATFRLNSSEFRGAANTTVSCTVITNDPAPSWSNALTNSSSIYYGDSIMFNTSWTDNDGLNYSILSMNDTSAFINQSPRVIRGTSAVASFNKTVLADPGNITGWIMYANDTGGSWNQTSIQSFITGGLTWSSTSLSLPVTTVGAAQNYANNSFISYLTNSNVNLSCISGSCSTVTSNYTPASFSNGQIGSLWFTCDSSVTGTYSATFKLNSTESRAARNTTVSCFILQNITKKNITLNSPLNEAMNVKLNPILNITPFDPNVGAMNVSFYSLARGKEYLGDYHSCMIAANGSIYCTGRNGDGQVGDGTMVEKHVPTPINTTFGFVQVVGGLYFSCGLLINGSVMCWGDGSRGQFGDGSINSNPNPTFTKALEPFTQIAAGWYHTCGVLVNGSIQCWGYNGDGEVGTGNTVSPQTTPITVIAPYTFVQVVAGSYHTCGLLNNGSVMCWGANPSGQIGNGTSGAGDAKQPVFTNSTLPYMYLAAGESHTCGLRYNNSLQCWGLGSNGMLGTGKITNERSPVDVNMTNVPFIGMALGDAHTCGLAANGTVQCWGNGNAGQLGDGLGSTSQIPVTVNSTAKFVSIGAGNFYTCGVMANGSMQCWGQNNYGQVGDGTGGTGQDRSNPVPVLTPVIYRNESLYIGSISNIATASLATLTWGNLSMSTLYQWEAIVDDGFEIKISPTWQFTTFSSAPPAWSNYTTNDSAVYQYDTVLFSSSWSDYLGLSNGILSTNNTGSFQNETSLYAFSGTTEEIASIPLKITLDPGNTTGWIMYANDTTGRWNQTPLASFVVGGVTWAGKNVTVPQANQLEAQNYTNSTFTSYLTNTNVNLTCISGNCNTVTSNYTTATYGNNAIGSLWFTCDTTQAGSFSATFKLNSTEFRGAANTTVSCDITIGSDTVPPNWSSAITNDSAIYQYDTVMLNASWSDSGGLNYSVLSTNNTGTFVNETPRVIAGTSAVGTFNKTITLTPGNVTGWQMFANDTSNNWNQTTTQTFTVGGLTWANTNLIIGNATIGGGQNYTNTTFTSYLSNTNVNLTCISGNCNVVTSNYTIATYSNNAIGSIWFTCDAAVAGNYSAVFKLNSSEFKGAANTTVFCLVNYQCSGDVPSTASDWNVTTTTVCVNQSITIGPGYNLNIRGGNLTIQSGSLSVGNNITIQNNGNFTLSNASLNLTGSLDINTSSEFNDNTGSSTIWIGGNLTVRGTFLLFGDTLRFNGSSNGSSGVTLASGSMFGVDKSIITNGVSAARYFFVAQPDINLTIINSTISYAGWNNATGSRGVEINSTNASISNSKFINNYAGITIYSNVTNYTLINTTSNVIGLIISGDGNVFQNAISLNDSLTFFIQGNKNRILRLNTSGAAIGGMFSGGNDNYVENSIVTNTQHGFITSSTNITGFILNSNINVSGTQVNVSVGTITLLNTSLTSYLALGRIDVKWFVTLNVSNGSFGQLPGSVVTLFDRNGINRTNSDLGSAVTLNITDWFTDINVTTVYNNYSINFTRDYYDNLVVVRNITNSTSIIVNLTLTPLFTSNVSVNNQGGNLFGASAYPISWRSYENFDRNISLIEIYYSKQLGSSDHKIATINMSSSQICSQQGKTFSCLFNWSNLTAVQDGTWFIDINITSTAGSGNLVVSSYNSSFTVYQVEQNGINLSAAANLNGTVNLTWSRSGCAQIDYKTNATDPWLNLSTLGSATIRYTDGAASQNDKRIYRIGLDTQCANNYTFSTELAMKIDVNLQEIGWHSIGVPLDFDNKSLTEVLRPLSQTGYWGRCHNQNPVNCDVANESQVNNSLDYRGNFSQAVYFTMSGGSVTFEPTVLASGLSSESLQTMDYGNGYFIKITNASSITFAGKLRKGFSVSNYTNSNRNYFSSIVATNQSVRDVFQVFGNGNWGRCHGRSALQCNLSNPAQINASIDYVGNLTLISYRKPSGTVLTFNPAVYYTFINTQTLQTIEPGKGYYIIVNDSKKMVGLHYNRSS